MNDDTREFLRGLAGEHQTEQAIEAMRNLASGLWAFYAQSMEAGFSVEQAFALTAVLLEGMPQMWSGGRE